MKKENKSASSFDKILDKEYGKIGTPGRDKFEKFRKKNLTSHEEHLDKQYGKRGAKKREEYEAGAEAFMLGVMLQEKRKDLGLTQEQLAEKCGTTKTYISRIENNASDIRLSTLMRIVREGFGAHLKLSME